MSYELGLSTSQIYKYLWNKRNRDNRLKKEIQKEEIA